MQRAASHLMSLLHPEKFFTTTERVLAGLRASGVDYDTIVCVGLSGVMIVPYIAAVLGKQIAIIRKPGEVRHSDNVVEFLQVHTPLTRYIFLDDLIDSGRTFRDVLTVMHDQCPHALCVGVVMHDEAEINREDETIEDIRLIKCPYCHVPKETDHEEDVTHYGRSAAVAATT